MIHSNISALTTGYGLIMFMAVKHNKIDESDLYFNKNYDVNKHNKSVNLFVSPAMRAKTSDPIHKNAAAGLSINIPEHILQKLELPSPNHPHSHVRMTPCRIKSC